MTSFQQDDTTINRKKEGNAMEIKQKAKNMLLSLALSSTTYGQHMDNYLD